MNASIARDRLFKRVGIATIDDVPTAARRGPRVGPVAPPRSLNERHRFEAYLSRLDKAPTGLSPAHAVTVRSVWQQLRAQIEGLSLPAAGPSADGFQLVWSTSALLVEIDVLPDGSLHWFASDRTTRVHEGSEAPVAELASSVLAWLRRLSRR